MELIVVGVVLLLASVALHAQGQPSRCVVAQLIVDGAYLGAQAKQHGQSYDQQVEATHAMAGKLAGTYGSKVGGTYQDVEVKLLQSLYTNSAYAQMSPEQFRDAMQSSFYGSANCPHAI
ncbi:hypothetical protein ACFONN_10210 [Dyella humi]|uniref:Uncharacterized protein n=1 Tax=Dyella humi TaxID=1770547 RepID=A0ABW8IJJ3_9GAMM